MMKLQLSCHLIAQYNPCHYQQFHFFVQIPYYIAIIKAKIIQCFNVYKKRFVRLSKFILGTIYKLTKECTTNQSFRKLEQ